MDALQKQAYNLWFNWLADKIMEWKDAKPLNKDLRNCIKAMNEIGLFVNGLRTENEVLIKRVTLIRHQKNELLQKQKEQIDKMKALTYKVNIILSELFINSGLILVDFKVEFGVSSKGKILLADEFTPDGCRLWDSETLKKMDKDRFRQGLGDVVESYHQVADRLGMNIIVD